MTKSPYTIETINAEDEVIHLQNDWNHLSLASDYPNVFMTFDWFQSWYQRFAGQGGSRKIRPNILILKENGMVTGISPLIRTISSRFGFSIRRLQFLAREHEWDYNDLVVGKDAEEQTDAFVDFLSHTSQEWDLIDLRDLRETGNVIPRIKAAMTKAGLPYRQFPEEERCPYLPIDGPWSELIGLRSSATRHTFRNLQSRLRKMAGDGLRERIIENPHEETGLLEKMVKVEAQKSVRGKLSQPFLGLHLEVFASLFDRLGPRGWLSVVVMELGDRLLAWHLLFRCGRNLWGYLTAYDHSFARLSPGTMLIPTIVDYGFSSGFTEYDFLSGEESYKMQWASGFHHRYRLLIWNRRWKSRLSALAYLKLRVRPRASSRVERPI